MDDWDFLAGPKQISSPQDLVDQLSTFRRYEVLADSVSKGMGGRVIGSESAQRMRNAAQRAVSVWMRHQLRGPRPVVRVEIGATTEYKAAVNHTDEHGSIILSEGALSILEDLFNRILDTRGILPNLGDCNLIRYDRASLSEAYRDARYLPKASPDRIPAFSPDCPVRANTAARWMDIASQCLTLHELAHIVCGHLLFKKRFFRNGVPNEQWPVAADANSVQRCFEWDADSFVIPAMLGNLATQHGVATPAFDSGLRDFIWAGRVLHRYFGFGPQAPARTHPNSISRVIAFDSVVAGWCDRAVGEYSTKLLELLKHAMADCERAMQSVFIASGEIKETEEVFTEGILTGVREQQSVWNQLYPILIQLAYWKRLAPPSDD